MKITINRGDTKIDIEADTLLAMGSCMDRALKMLRAMPPTNEIRKDDPDTRHVSMFLGDMLRKAESDDG